MSGSWEGTDSVILEEIGERLAHTRLERNLSQEALATEAGVSKATIERLEAGEPVKSTSLIRVLRALTLLDGLERAIPKPLPSPVERARLQGRRRQRAGAERAKPPAEPWRWGADEGKAESR